MIEKVRAVRRELQPHVAVRLEAEGLADPQVDTVEVRPDPSVSANVEEAIRAPSGVAIDVGPGQQRKWNASADEDNRAEAHVGKDPRQEGLAGPGVEWSLEDATEDEVVPDVEGRQRPFGEEPRRKRGREG